MLSAPHRLQIRLFYISRFHQIPTHTQTLCRAVKSADQPGFSLGDAEHDVWVWKSEGNPYPRH